MKATRENVQHVIDSQYHGDPYAAISKYETITRANHYSLILAQRNEDHDRVQSIKDTIRENSHICRIIHEMIEEKTNNPKPIKGLDKLMAIHNLVKNLMSTRDFEGVRLLGKIILDNDIATKKTYMVATKPIKEKLGLEREQVVESYNKEMIANGHTPV